MQPGGINPIPNQTTGGNGSVAGEEVEISVSFATPFTLPADHYFFVPQVQLNSGDFLWLSAPKPIVSPGTPFAPDLQSWTRDDALDPDWLRVGTDIVGAGAIQRRVRAERQPDSRALDLGDDAAWLRGPRLRQLARRKGHPRERVSHPS